MDYQCKTRNLQSLIKDMEKGNISLSHKLQRPEGQWSRRQKSDLIDSLLRKYPINPTYGIKDDRVLSIIDGVQRLSAIRDYINNQYSLSKNMKSIMINDTEINISGLKFSKLSDDVKDIIVNCELQVYELTGCSEEDVREMFRRQNAGKPLNNRQLRVVYESDAFNENVYNLANHQLMNQLLSNAQHKNGTDRDLIIQTLMLLCTTKDNDFTSFRSKDMDTFILDNSTMCNNKFEVLNNAMDELADKLEKIKIPISSIPMVLYNSCQVKSISKLVTIIKDFVENYDNNEEYKSYIKSDTSGQENVRGRLGYWAKLTKKI